MLCSLVHACSARLILNADEVNDSTPLQCPKCCEDVDMNPATSIRLEVDLLPSPFSKQQQDLSSSIIVKPSCGTFLNSYSFGADLHIGIFSATRKSVVSYWTNGIECDDSGWDSSLVVYSFTDPAAADCQLSEFVNDNLQLWSAQNYHPNLHNCFDFVVDFAKHSNLVHSDMSKEQFVESFVKERLKSALKYISIFHCVQRTGLIAL